MVTISSLATFPVTTPSLETEAIVESEDVHVSSEFAGCCPSSPETSAISVKVSFTLTSLEPVSLVILIEATLTGSLTTKVIVLLTPSPFVAVIVTSPAPTAVTNKPVSPDVVSLNSTTPSTSAVQIISSLTPSPVALSGSKDIYNIAAMTKNYLEK